MPINEALPQPSVSARSDVPPQVVPDADFDARWASWTARGRVHDQIVRRRMMTCGCAIALGAAVVYGLVR